MADALRRRGYEVVTVDNDKSRKADITENILTWRYKDMYPVGYFDIVAASPPCTEYSTAMSTRRPRKLEESDALVAKALEIIQHLKPRLWWIENPRWGLLRTRQVVKDLPCIDLDYCQFGEGRFRKATRFWCCDEISRRPSVLCDFQHCEALDQEYNQQTGRQRHLQAIGGGQGRCPRRDDVLRIPSKLVDYLCGFKDTVNRAGREDEWKLVEKKSKSKRDGNEKENGTTMEKKTVSKTAVREVQVHPWHVQPIRPFRIGRV